jgi:HEAT repeat protein
MLDQAFDALKSYDWGQDTKALNPIDDAIVASHGDSARRGELEKRLAALLKSDVSLDAKQYVCRKLMVIGTSDSVPALAALLSDKQLSHMARFALERIPGPEAAAALRDALPKLSGELKIGVIGSLGSRRDEASVPALVEMIGEGDAGVARAAAYALGAIRSPQAAQALSQAKAGSDVAPAVTDASLACAEALLADGKNNDALAIYKRLAAGNPPKHVKLAATRGMLASATKQ